MVKDTNKKKRGRPKKQPKQLPKFRNDNEIRKYLINEGLRLSLELIELATKKNNIKRSDVARAKIQQYKTALDSLKIVNSLLKDKQFNEFEEKLQLMEEGITASIINDDDTIQPSENVVIVLDELQKMNKELASIKGSD